MPAKSRPVWISFAVVVALTIGGLWYNSSSSADPNQPPIIRSPAEYNDTLAKARELSETPLLAFAKGDQLGPDQVLDLKKAAVLFEGLKNYQPDNTGVDIGLGKIYEATGDAVKAKLNFQQAIASAGPSSSDPGIIATVAEAHYELAMNEIKAADFTTAAEDAAEAVRIAPLSADYLVAEASALVQLKQVEQAKSALAKALKLDPENRSALALTKLIQMSRNGK